MTGAETPELLDLQLAARGVFADLASSESVHRAIDSAPGRDDAIEAQLRELGFYTALLDSGGTLAHLMRIVTEAGAACATTRLVGHAAGVGTALALSPSSARRDTTSSEVLDGRVGTVLGCGSAADHFVHRRSETGFVVDGREPFAIDADDTDFMVLFSDGDDGPIAAVVPAADLDVVTLRTIDRTRVLGTVTADSLVVVPEQILARGEGARALRTAVESAVSLALSHDSVGIATRALDLTVAYARTREQFGRAIGSFQAVKHQAADMAVRTELSRCACDGALEAVLTGHPDAARTVALTRELVSRGASWVAGRAVQLHGGIGYTWEHDAHILLKRAKLNEKLGSTPAQRRALVLSTLPAPATSLDQNASSVTTVGGAP